MISQTFRSFRAVPLLALACLLPASAQEGTAEKGGLAWQLKPGDRLPYGLSLTLEETMELKGVMPPQQATTEVGYGATHEVKAVDGDVATVEATIESIRARIGMGMMGEMAYDSKSDDTLNPMRGIRHAVGKKFTYKLSRSGKISEVTGGDAVVKAMMEAMSTEAPPPDKGGQGGGMGGMMGFDPAAMAAQAAQQLSGMLFSDAALTSLLKLVNEVLPEDPAASSWNRDVDMTLPGAGRLRFKAAHANAGQAEGNARIDTKVDGELQFDRDLGGAGGDPMAEQVRKMMGDATVTRKEAHGSGSFSTAKGRLLDSEMVVEIDSEGDLPPFMKAMMGQQGGQVPDDLKMARNTAVTLRYQLEGATPAPAPTEPQKTPTPGKGGERF